MITLSSVGERESTNIRDLIVKAPERRETYDLRDVVLEDDWAEINRELIQNPGYNYVRLGAAANLIAQATGYQLDNQPLRTEAFFGSSYLKQFESFRNNRLILEGIKSVAWLRQVCGSWLDEVEQAERLVPFHEKGAKVIPEWMTSNNVHPLHLVHLGAYMNTAFPKPPGYSWLKLSQEKVFEYAQMPDESTLKMLEKMAALKRLAPESVMVTPTLIDTAVSLIKGYRRILQFSELAEAASYLAILLATDTKNTADGLQLSFEHPAKSAKPTENVEPLPARKIYKGF